MTGRDYIARTMRNLPRLICSISSVILTCAGVCAGQAGDRPPLTEPYLGIKAFDFNDEIYYRNKLELSTETGVLFANIPFVYDVFVGGDYSQKPLHYTLVPVFPSVRWHMGKLSGPGILRGNTDLTATLSITAIPRGPESVYGAFDLGFRRNFVQRNWRVAPYFESRCGVGFIDAKGHHVRYAQGQDLTFTLMTGSGFRYNFSPRYSLAVGANYMHVSNLYLSEPRYTDNGINVLGPWIGFNVEVGKRGHGAK